MPQKTNHEVAINKKIIFLKKQIKELRYRLEKEREQKEFYKYIIQSLPGNVFWKNLKQMFLGCNRNIARIFGLKHPNDIFGKANQDLFDKEIAKQNDEADKKAIDEDKEYELEETGLDVQGNLTTYLTRKIPLKDKSGKIIGLLGVSIDIKKRKKLEEALKKSNTVKQEFIANMSHDLRTPITGIMGMLNDLLHFAAKIESKRDFENQLVGDHAAELLQKLLQKVEDNSYLALGAVDGLLHLCNEILETVRLESRTTTMPLEAFNLPVLINAVIKLVNPTAKAKGLTLSTKINNQLPQYLFGSARYLSKSLLNLISNALKFTDEGSINVSVKLVDTPYDQFKKGDKITLMICVADTGIGIPKDKFDTIFEHFSRLDPSYKGMYKGYGLGLYTVKQYVEGMKGTITVDSDVGKGTKFTLMLPFTVDDHTDNILPEIDQPMHLQTQYVTTQAFNESEPHDNTCVLVVEDMPVARVSAKNTLEQSGCRSAIDFASTGEIALKKATENDYDLILMDIGLPKMQGTEVAQKIRALDDPIKSKVPIVAFTGHADPEQKKEFLALGMNDLIIKPSNIANMTRVLQTYIFPKSNAMEKDQTDESIKAPLVFDWEASLKLDNVQDDENQLKEYLLLMFGELKVTKKIFVKSYQNKQMKSLCAELHRLRGALTYLVAPELNDTLKAFHEAVKAEPQDAKVLEETYQAAIAAIDHFQKGYAKGFK